MIHIGMDPNIAQIGTFTLAWHGFFAFVAVVVAVILVARWAKQNNIIEDVVYSTAIWAIIGGILGARIVHVIDWWDYYGQNLADVFAIWNGGIALFGAILGGLLSGAIYAKLQGYPIGKLADLTAPALLIAQSIGRIGDIINGEHLSKSTDFSWGFVYTHPDSLSNQVHGLSASHPVILYEIIWNMMCLALIWSLRGRLKPDGMLFALYLSVYSLGRFFISFLRQDRTWFAGLQEAHIISIIVVAIALPLLVYRARVVQRGE